MDPLNALRGQKKDVTLLEVLISCGSGLRFVKNSRMLQLNKNHISTAPLITTCHMRVDLCDVTYHDLLQSSHLPCFVYVCARCLALFRFVLLPHCSTASNHIQPMCRGESAGCEADGNGHLSVSTWDENRWDEQNEMSRFRGDSEEMREEIYGELHRMWSNESTLKVN